MLDPVIIVFALAAGLAAKRLSFPPMLGYLIAGFLVSAIGIEAKDLVGHMASVGITLLLFTIGLKLDLRELASPRVWATGSAHMVLYILISLGILIMLSAVFGAIAQLDTQALWTVAFALSFSSTVFAVKVFDEHGENNSAHAQIAIGILVLQDLVAVVFLAISSGKPPLISSVLLLLLIPARPFLHRLLQWCGHGELVTLFGIGIAFSGYALFEFFQIKGDLGALLLGILLGGGTKTTELSKALLNLKDLFLVGFFLSIGMSGLPEPSMILLALALGVAVTLKPLLYYPLMIAMKLRARTALLASLALFNYSEFGLIVAAIAVHQGLLQEQWIVCIALALAVSFFLSVPLNTHGHNLYNRYRNYLIRFSRAAELQTVGCRPVMVLGMGRVGSGAYEFFQDHYPGKVIGVEENTDKVLAKQSEEKHVVKGDASDRDFWAKVDFDKIELILISLTNHAENVEVVQLLRELNYQKPLAVIARFPDEMEQLKQLGCITYNLYAEAGFGFAEHIHTAVDSKVIKAC